MRCLLSLSFLFINWHRCSTWFTVLLCWRWYIRTILWHFEKDNVAILIFAFSYYVIIYGPTRRINSCTLYPMARFARLWIQHLLYAALQWGLVSSSSNVFNNHPALMIVHHINRNGLESSHILKTYLSCKHHGSDSVHYYYQLVRLASLDLDVYSETNKIKVKWKDNLSVSLIVIPLTTGRHTIPLILLGTSSSSPYNNRAPFATRFLAKCAFFYNKVRYYSVIQSSKEVVTCIDINDYQLLNSSAFLFHWPGFQLLLSLSKSCFFCIFSRISCEILILQILRSTHWTEVSVSLPLLQATVHHDIPSPRSGSKEN